jgi:hypothetical protein
MLTIILIYAAGFLLSLLILSAFGKSKMNIDFDNDHDKWPDDWETNAEAYVAWSLAWPLGFILLSLVGVWAGLTKLTQFLIDIFNKDNE